MYAKQKRHLCELVRNFHKGCGGGKGCLKKKKAYPYSLAIHASNARSMSCRESLRRSLHANGRVGGEPLAFTLRSSWINKKQN